ncbi:MAG: hypothetical protein ACMVO3_25140 [Thalassobaculum sp.]
MPDVPVKSTSIPSSDTVRRADQIDLVLETVDPHGVSGRFPSATSDLRQHAGARTFDDVPAEIVEIGHGELAHHLDEPAPADLVAGHQGVDVALDLDSDCGRSP